MSIIGRGSAIGTDTLHELQDILSSDYNEEGVFKTSRSICLRTDKRFGIGFLTPNDLVSRVVGYVNRKAEDAGMRDMESFRQISDVVGIIVPQTSSPANLTLTLVDSADFMSPVNDQVVNVGSEMGPCIFVMNCAHSIPNSDRVTVDGKETHRRLGIQYECESDTQGAVTTFAVTLLWREAFSMRPSFYKVDDARIIPITVGYKKAIMARSHKDLAKVVSRGLITTGHEKMTSVQSSVPVNLLDKPAKTKISRLKDIKVEEIEAEEDRSQPTPSSSSTSNPPNTILRTIVSDNGKPRPKSSKAPT
ncbi:movememt protein [Ligustrum chlorotic spot virus]|uniref:movememt protein n=1 Tax=Ligustrum chlorotic spot virus TaxID=2921791 RepID=UPI0024837B1F|nr:movememt protein [Ligustrum chlorotic spot virus]UNH55555.1 movememt protein [Ligustrum chlorotic spot virus]